MPASQLLASHLNGVEVGKVVDFNPAKDKLLQLDMTAANAELTPELVADTPLFSKWVSQKLSPNNCRYGIGGYMEHRTVYNRSSLFNTTDEPRRLHLGVDIWADAGVPVYAPLAGQVHSFADNSNFGDYGPSIILQHNINGLTVFSLYGHLSRESLKDLNVGQLISINQQIGTFGTAYENGSWPPHLHFQLMLDIGDCLGDYPGVGQFSKKEEYLNNLPDPQLILRHSGFSDHNLQEKL